MLPFHPTLRNRLIEDVMRCLEEGIVKLVQPLNVMSFSQIEEAFRIMQTGKHIGKIVLKLDDNDVVPV